MEAVVLVMQRLAEQEAVFLALTEQEVKTAWGGKI